MSGPIQFVWKREKPYKVLPGYWALFMRYQDNYVEYTGKEYDELSLEDRRRWEDWGLDLIRAGDLARNDAIAQGARLAYVSFEMPPPTRALGPGGKIPLVAVPKELKSTQPKRSSKPYERKKAGPKRKAARATRPAGQSESEPLGIPPPPPASTPQLVQHQPHVGPVGSQPPTASHVRSIPPITPNAPDDVSLDYYQTHDPDCPLIEGELPGPRSDSMLRDWIARQKELKAEAAVKAKVKEAVAKAAKEAAAMAKERQTVRAVQVQVIEVVKRQTDDVCAEWVEAHDAMDIDWSTVIDPVLMAE